jgi:hypothetical protein
MAFQYIDKGGSEYLRSDDAEMLLHNLGANLSRKQVGMPCGRMLAYSVDLTAHTPSRSMHSCVNKRACLLE